MRARIVFPLLLSALTACTPTPREATPPAAGPIGDVMVLGTRDGSLIVRSDSGSVLAEDAGNVTAFDGSRLYATRIDGGTTTLEARDPVSGAVLSSTAVPGSLEARVASISGDIVALMPPGRGTAGELAEPHRRTTIVVADPTGSRAPRMLRLDGNFEPEAFSADERRLFLIQYLPATAPSVYRVMFLDLASERIRPVFGRFKTPPERMPGVRLNQVFDGTSDQLYTLYTNRPSEGYTGAWDGRGYGDAGSEGATDAPPREVSFVHVLNLRDGWAFCAGLPKRLWGRPATAQAMATSPDGRHLYVVDSTRGLVADLNTRTLRIRGTARLDLKGTGGDRTAAVTSVDGSRLFVASALDGRAIYAIDTTTMEVAARWPMPATVHGLARSEDGERLYAALADRIVIVDPATGDVLRTVSIPGASILHVATP